MFYPTILIEHNADYRLRTCDLLFVRQALVPAELNPLNDSLGTSKSQNVPERIRTFYFLLRRKMLFQMSYRNVSPTRLERASDRVEAGRFLQLSYEDISP